MTLSSALHTAQSIFRNTGEQTSIVSKNMANSGNVDYVRRSATIMTSDEGATVVGISRAQNVALQKQMFLANSAATGQDSLLTGLEQMRSALGGNDYELSPSEYLLKFQTALHSFAASPGERSLAETTVSAAQDVVNAVNNATTAVQTTRQDADKEINTQVEKLNTLLANFETVNNQVISATASGKDPSDALDQRDALLRQISGIVGVNVIQRENNDVSLYTTDGTTLFERVPRAVTFTPTLSYGATTVGNFVYIDGIKVEPGVGGDSDAMGSLAGLLQLRDEVAPKFQNQLDEVARSLVEAFAEVPVSGANPSMPGLFTWSGGTVPTAGTLVPGISTTLTVNPAYVTAKGGNPMLLRDGGANNTTPASTPNPYVWNTSGGAGYSTLLDKLEQNLTADRPYDTTANLDSHSNIMSFAADSIGWLEGLRSGATSGYENKVALQSRAQEAYSNTTGVSLDEELSLLLDVEQSYKASAKLVSAVDEMLQSLLAMVR